MRKLWFVAALCLLLIAPAMADERIVNGGFETGNFTGWTLYKSVSAVNIEVSSNAHTGAGSACIWSTTAFNADYGSLTQSDVDLTGISALSMYLYGEAQYLRIYIDGTQEHYTPAPFTTEEQWTPIHVDVSKYSGLHSVQIKAYTANTHNPLYIDDITTSKEWTAPTAAFSLDKTTAAAPAHITLTDQTSGEVTEYTIDWGDGTTQYTSWHKPSSSISHKYSSDGEYTITVTAKNPAGTSQSTKTVTVTGYGRIENGGFETGDFTGWTLYKSVSAVHIEVSSNAHTGTGSACIWSTTAFNADYGSLTQSDVDLTGISALSMYLYGEAQYLRIYIDGTQEHYTPGPFTTEEQWTPIHVDVSKYSGLHSVQIKAYTANTHNPLYIDDITTIPSGRGTTTFDADSYYSGQTATLNTTINNPITGTYQYKGVIISPHGERLETWTIRGDTDTHTIDIPGAWTTGTYIAYLILEDTSTHDEYLLAYDAAQINCVIAVSGTVYNAVNSTPLEGATVTGTMGTDTKTATSDASGHYTFTIPNTFGQLTMNATLANFTHSDYSFSPYISGEQTVNLYLSPSSPTYNGTSIGGIVRSDSLRQAIPGATLNLSNATWSTTTTANPTGYYRFDSIPCPGEYNLTSTATGYRPATVTATTSNNTYTPQNVEQTGVYTVHVEVRDVAKEGLIPVASVECSNGDSQATTTGKLDFTTEYGQWRFIATSEGYDSNYKDVVVSEDTTVTIYLSKDSASTGAGIQYPPHNVKFTIKSAWGAPIEGTTVTAQGYETTAGAWEWFKSLLGINTEETPLLDTEMTGTTGTDGSIDFMMVEAVKYRVTITKPGEIDTVWEGYPKDEYYTIYASFGTSQWFKDGYNPLDVINVTAVKNANATAAAITVYYNDTLAQTTSATLFLNQTFSNGTTTATDSYTVGSSSSFSHTFNLAGDHRGESYQIKLVSTHGTFGTYERTAGIFFDPAPMSFGLPEDLLLFIAMGLIIFTALFFGQSSVPAGAVVIAFEAWIFFYFGWWRDLGDPVTVFSVLTFISLVAGLTAFMHRSKRERYA